MKADEVGRLGDGLLWDVRNEDLEPELHKTTTNVNEWNRLYLCIIYIYIYVLHILYIASIYIYIGDIWPCGIHQWKKKLLLHGVWKWIPGEENAPIRARNHVCYSKQCVCVSFKKMDPVKMKYRKFCWWSAMNPSGQVLFCTTKVPTSEKSLQSCTTAAKLMWPERQRARVHEFETFETMGIAKLSWNDNDNALLYLESIHQRYVIHG